MKELLGKPLTREEIVKAVEARRKGSYRTVTWIHLDTTVDGHRITVTKTAPVRIGIDYNKMKSVVERRKALEVAGRPASLRKSAYVHDRTHGFIVYDRSTRTKEYLQVFGGNAMRFSWTVGADGRKVRSAVPAAVTMRCYVDGVGVDPSGLPAAAAAIMAKTPSSGKDSTRETFVLPFSKVLFIR